MRPIGGGATDGKRGIGAAGSTLIFVAVSYNERKLQRIRLLRIPDISGSTLLDAVACSIVPGSTVDTNGWHGYHGLKAAGYVHRNVRVTSSNDTDLLPRVQIVVSLLKRWLAETHQGGVQASHLEYYLDEFTFRINRRSSHTRGSLFRCLLENAVQLEPLREVDLHSIPSDAYHEK